MSKLVTGADYLNLPREPETWLIRPLLPQGGAMILYGDPKIGKSYAALQLAKAIQEGQEWLGFETKPGPVVYIQLDTPRSLWASRLEDLRESGVDTSKLWLADRDTIGMFPFNILNPEHFLALKETVGSVCDPVTGEHMHPSCVILDTIREAHSGDENDSTVMRNVIAQLVAATQPAALILIAHSKKPNAEAGPDLINDTRGSSYVVGRMDAIARFTKKGFYYTGRAIESGHLKVERLDNGLWTAQDDSLDNALLKVMHDPSLTTMKARAEALALATGKNVETARSMIRRSKLTPLDTVCYNRASEQERSKNEADATEVVGATSSAAPTDELELLLQIPNDGF